MEIDFYHLGVLPRMPTNQMRVSPVHTSLRVTGEKNSFLPNVEIDFYHLGVLPRMPTNQMSVTRAHGGNSWFYHFGNWFLPWLKFIFAIVETAFYYHRRHSKCLVSFDFITMITLNGKPPNLDTWPWESGWKSYWWHANPPSHPAITLVNLPSSSKEGWM